MIKIVIPITTILILLLLLLIKVVILRKIVIKSRETELSEKDLLKFNKWSFQHYKIYKRTTKYCTKWVIYEKYAFHRKQLFYITDTFSDAKAVFYNALRCDVNILNYKLLEKEERIL